MGFKWPSTKARPLEARSETIDLNRKPRSPSFWGQNISQSLNTTGFWTGFHKGITVRWKNGADTDFRWSPTKGSPLEAHD